MRRLPALLCLAIALLVAGAARGDFRSEQKRFPRVRAAYEHHEKSVRALFEEKGLAFPPRHVFLRGFKRDRALELWGRDGTTDAYRLVKTYKICATSGDLGPKRREGDGQVPEGFYTLDHFNPTSEYHLSMRVSYPNGSDRALSRGPRLGGSIFVHGNCVTIGCLPIKDEGIEELYVIVVEAKAAGSSLPIHLFPTKLTENAMANLALEYASRPKLLAFWKNLREGYDRFERDKRVPAVSVAPDGTYRFPP